MEHEPYPQPRHQTRKGRAVAPPRHGHRFTVNGPKNRTLPGRPDIVLPKYRTVIFVHGCFWHRHKGCKGTTTPKTRTDWWEAKFAGNVARDRRNQRSLRKEGWRVIVVWECELVEASKNQIQSKIRRYLDMPVVQLIPKD